ncbi:DUF2189 domain-containing protein [Motiliproteus sediminis]|uniref:DUF2189 domain-containing protein n=1 Tax=Motiliproteus sediminis TaxID=1468178 RepID=UPI001AEF7F63|nr:DUF2189 domain-containing protein [Motiliproteus sediminis]
MNTHHATPDSTQASDTTPFARRLPCHKVDATAPFHWLALAVKDLRKTPLLSLLYGLAFSLIPAAIMYVAIANQTHLTLLPAVVAFSLIGPIFAVGLYDVAWQLEKGERPSLGHSLRSVIRNPVGEWGFALLLTILMIAWMRLAALIHALYPSIGEPSLAQMMPFLLLGSVVGGVLMITVFALSAFTPQICLERRVDLMTAVTSSIHAVRENLAAMTVWAGLILACVMFGFATSAIGFIVVMPLLSFASWHAYIAVIATRRERHYE